MVGLELDSRGNRWGIGSQGSTLFGADMGTNARL